MTPEYCILIRDSDVRDGDLPDLYSSGIRVGERRGKVDVFEDVLHPGRMVANLASAHIVGGRVRTVLLAPDLPASELARVATGVMITDANPVVRRHAAPCERHGEGCSLLRVGAPAGEFMTSFAVSLLAEADRGSVVVTTTSTSTEAVA